MFRSGHLSSQASKAYGAEDLTTTSKETPKETPKVAVPRPASPITSEHAKQPTYTTVGSIYNPDAAVPLQPPTRRPRTRRQAPTLFSNPGDTFLGLSASLLSGFSVRDRVQESPPPATYRVPHYSPLQQNCDRAVSPGTDQEDIFRNTVGMAAPTIRSGNLPPPTLSSTLGLGTDKQGAMGVGDSDSVASEDTLASSRITVKGLTNLASYPNPMQRAAQNTLARARNANFALGRSTTPSVYTGSDLSKERLTSTTSIATGAPRPLTAGPPGQRQFKPSTLETNPRAGAFVAAFEPSPSIALESLPPPAIPFNDQNERNMIGLKPRRVITDDHFPETARLESLAPGSRVPTKEHSTISLDSAERPPNRWYERGTVLILPPPEEKPMRDTLPPDMVMKYYPEGLPRNYRGQNSHVDESWCYDSLHRPPGVSESPEKRAEREHKQNQWFYSGMNGLGRDMTQVVSEHENPPPKNKVGVIGEGRDRFKASQSIGGATGRASLRVEVAAQMQDHLHTEPLLSMALAALLRQKEGGEAAGPRPNYVQVDPSWIDDSAEGHSSFFETPKVDKKKKVIKRVRRGY